MGFCGDYFVCLVTILLGMKSVDLLDSDVW